MTYSVFRAAAMETARKRSAAVLPRVGAVYSRPGDGRGVLRDGQRGATGEQHSRDLPQHLS
ncbi:MAG: hypothetical protein ABS36_04965 [Acidobacteria bacterium SCN 69-37]|nr:MAG: hypothetical protein ABS36_04965 [Acidobacteria bacterium SCN 69-37]